MISLRNEGGYFNRPRFGNTFLLRDALTAIVPNCIPTHAAYADESSHNKGRFRGIGVVTLSVEDAATLTAKLRSILTLSELKWSDLRNPRVEIVAKDFIKVALSYVRARRLRIDVLTWDTHDSRHKILGRDDSENLRRMYYHLLHNVFRMRWSRSCVWRVYPDENTALDSETLLSCLDSKSYRVLTRPSLNSHFDDILIMRQYGICEIKQCQSHKEPLIQLADLFVGLGVYSRDHYDDFELWTLRSADDLKANAARIEPVERRHTYSQLHRFEVLQAFHRQCQAYQLAVDLEKTRGLKTPMPNTPINYWQYQPQRPSDKTPRRVKQVPRIPAAKTDDTDNLEEAS